MSYSRLFVFDLGISGLTTVGYYLGSLSFSQAGVYERLVDGTFRAIETPISSVGGTGKYQALIQVPSGTVNSLLWASNSSASALTGIDEINPGGNTELIDIATSTRGTSNYAGGVVAGVASGVTLAPNQDVRNVTGSLTPAERTLIANAVQSGILDEGDGQTILAAIINSINNADIGLHDISVVAVATGVISQIERAGGMLALVKASTDKIPANPAASGESATAATGVNSYIDSVIQSLATKAVQDAIKLKTDLIPANPATTTTPMILTSDYDRAKTAAKPSEVSSTPIVNPTPVTVSGGFLDADRTRLGQTSTLQNIADAKQAILDAFGSFQASSLTPAQEQLLEDIKSKVSSIGVTSLTLQSVIDSLGNITLYQGYTVKRSRGNAPDFNVAADLTNSVVELRLGNGQKIGPLYKEKQPDQTWLVWLEIDDSDSVNLTIGNYSAKLAAIYTDSEVDNVLRGTLSVNVRK